MLFFGHNTSSDYSTHQQRWYNKKTPVCIVVLAILCYSFNIFEYANEVYEHEITVMHITGLKYTNDVLNKYANLCLCKSIYMWVY